MTSDQKKTSDTSTVIKGPRYTRWSAEVPKSAEPYHNRLFEIPFKPPPNELTYLGGLGARKPRFRSKVHPVRPTAVQQLCRQRTGNRINFSLTEAPIRAKKAIPKKKTAVESAKNYVDRVCFADNLDSPKSPRSITPPSSGSRKSQQGQIAALSTRQSSLLKLTDDPVENYLNTKRRASAQGLLHDLRQFSLETDSPRDNDILDFLESVRKTEKPVLESGNNSAKAADHQRHDLKSNQQKKPKLLSITKQKQVDGALYGPIIAEKSQGIATKLSEKFQLPKAMVDRLARKYSAKDASAVSNRKSMRGHMQKPFPQSDSSTEEDDQKDYEQVKSLTLVRTGYCTIPRIRVGQRRRKERLKTNRFLDKHQLSRIRYLLFDERKKWSKPSEVELDKQPPPFVANSAFIGSFGKSSFDDTVKSQPSVDQIGQGQPKLYQKLKTFIRQYRKDKETQANKGNLVNFEGFKNGLLDGKLKREDEKTKNREPQIKKVSIYDGDKKSLRNKGILKKFRIAHPPKLFKKTRTRQSFRGIDDRDAQYSDPNFMTKQRFPELNKESAAGYSLQCTMRYHTSLRDRLQVNTRDYDEERFGFGEKKFLHCLATEWDENFVNELEATKKFKTFRVKTDIIRLREVLRRNFNQYYILENLANLRHKQRHEEAFIEETNRFAKMCVEYLDKLKVQAYNSLIEKTNQLKPLEMETQLLEEREQSLRAKLEHVTESLLGIEQRWDTILKLQNYYYALMSTEWRKQNDWIHRRPSDGQLENAIYSVDRCRTANIRNKSDPSGFAIIAYFDEHILPNLEKMREVQPDLQLLKKGLHSMQAEVFTYLNQYNKTLWLCDKIAQTLKERTLATKARLEAKEKQIYFRQMKQEFIEERNHVLQYEANQMTRKPLEEAIRNLQMRRVAAICEEMYKNVMPLELRSPEVDQMLDTTAKFSRLHQFVMDTLHALDTLPVAVLKFTETRTRKQRRKMVEEGKAAVVKQSRFELLQKQLRGFFFNLLPVASSSPSSSAKLQRKKPRRRINCKS